MPAVILKNQRINVKRKTRHPKLRPPPQPDDRTPGRPHEAGARQQHHPDQMAQTGSPELDRELTERHRRK
jgi:hypothetical protein